MGFNLGELLFSLKADTAQLRTDMAEAKAVIGDTAEGIAKSAEFARSSLELLGIAFGAHEAVEWVKTQIEVADKANKTAQKIGLTAEALTSLQYAAKLSDVDSEALQTSLVKLAKNMSEASTGASAQVAAFNAIGISVTDANGKLRGIDSVLSDVADRFSKMEDGAQKAALAQEIFGKAGANLIPFLNQGRDGIQKLREEAEKLGVVVGGETAKSAEEFNDNLMRLKSAGDGVAKALIADMLPALNRISNAMVEAAKDGGVLHALFVGLGGAAKEAFSRDNYTPIEQAKAQLKDLTHELEISQQALQGYGNSSVGPAEALRQKIESLQHQIELTIEWRDQLLNQKEPPKIKPPLIDTTGFLKDFSDYAEGIAKEDEKIITVSLNAAEAQFNANQKTVEGLQTQAATLGMAAGAAEIYKLKINDATEAQIALAQAAVNAKEKFAEQQEALQRSSDDFERFTVLRESAIPNELKSIQQLQDKYDELNQIVSRHPELAASASQVRAQLQDQEEKATDEKLRRLQEQQDREKQMKLEHEAALGDIEAQWELKRQKFSVLTESQKTKMILGELTTLTAGIAQHNRAAFEINKAASIATATVNTYEMAVGAYKAMASIPYVGPALGVAAAAAALAYGFAQIQAIDSATFSGGGGGTTPSAAASGPVVNGNPVSSSGPTSNGATAVPTTQIIIQGDLVSNHAETTLQDLKNLINNGDHVLIESTSRQAAELKAA